MSSQIDQFLSPFLLLPLFAWSAFWKALALWKASSKQHLAWFIILFLVNTAGILEMAYIFYLNKWSLDQGRLLNFLEKKFKGKSS